MKTWNFNNIITGHRYVKYKHLNNIHYQINIKLNTQEMIIILLTVLDFFQFGQHLQTFLEVDF